MAALVTISEAEEVQWIAGQLPATDAATIQQVLTGMDAYLEQLADPHFDVDEFIAWWNPHLTTEQIALVTSIDNCHVQYLTLAGCATLIVE